MAAIERQGIVRLDEVVVRANLCFLSTMPPISLGYTDLHWPIASICDTQANALTTSVDNDVLCARDDCTWEILSRIEQGILHWEKVVGRDGEKGS